MSGFLSKMFILLLNAAFATTAAAQDSQVITYREAIAIALERNVDLRQAQVDAATGEVGVSEARMRFLPDLRLGVTGARNYGQSFNQTEGRIVEQTTDSLSASASSGVTLFEGFRGVAALKQAKFTRTAGRLDLDRAAETVIFTVASDFLALVRRQEQLRVQREYLAGEARLEQQIQHYVEAGARAAADLYQQQANLAAARVAVIEGENAAQSAQVNLMRTLQLDPAGVYDFQAPDLKEADLERPIKLEDFLSRAFASRSDLQAMEAKLEAAEQGVRVAQSGYWPALSLNAGYGSAYTTASDLDFSDQLDLRRGGGVNLELSIPLFNRLDTRNASRRAHLEALSARIAFEEAREEVGLQVRQAYLDYQTARERFTAAQSQQHLAERAVLAAQERFKSGAAATLVELIQARTSYLLAENALANARAILAFQRTVMEYYAGDLDPGSPVTPGSGS